MKAFLPLLALVFFIPPAGASPIAGADYDYIHVSWTFGGVSGECYDHAAYATAEVNLKLVVALETMRGTDPGLFIPYDPTTLLPDAMCALLVTITPGVYTNACQILRGEAPTVAVRTDPYFQYESGYWRKTVSWSSGDYVDYTFRTNYRYGWDGFHGECRWGDATGSWDVRTDPIYV